MTAMCGRPSGELRLAVASCITALGPMTLHDLCAQVQSTPRALSSAVRNMLRDGALVKAGMERRPHAKRWVALYDLPGAQYDEAPIFPARDTGMTALQSALQGWTTTQEA